MPVLPVQQQSFQYISAFADGTGYVLDRGSNWTLWRTRDYGLTWDPQTSHPESSGFVQVRFATPKVGYALDDLGVWRNTEGAQPNSVWRRLRGPALPKGRRLETDSFSRGFAVTGKTIAFAGTAFGPVTAGCQRRLSRRVWTSHDGGRSWIAARLPIETSVQGIQYLNDRIGVVVAFKLEPYPEWGECARIGRTTDLYVTRDGGRHFTRAFSCASTPGQLCTTARFVNSKVLIGGRNDGTTVISTDSGRRFRSGQPLVSLAGATNTDQDNTFWVQGFSFAGRVGYATSKVGGAWRTVDGGRTWTREPSCDSKPGLGWGEVAAFDGNRAIAGGPTCISARVTAPGAAAAATPAASPLRRTSSWVGRSACRAVEFRANGVLVIAPSVH